MGNGRRDIGTEGTKSANGDHDEAVVTVVDLMLLWFVLALISATMADLRLYGKLPIDWWIVLAPIAMPPLVVLVIGLVVVSSDRVSAWRERAR